MPDAPAFNLHHPALSLWQSIVHRSLAGGDAGLQATADHPAMIAASHASAAVAAGGPATESLGGTVAAGAALYARLAVAKFEGDAEAIAKIEDELRYSVVDPLWGELLLQYERSLLEERVDAYPRHQSMDDFILAPIPDDVTIALVADWATGTPAARVVLEQIAALRPDVVIHLGDVYFSGLPEEVRAHVLDLLDAAFPDATRRPRVYSLAGNHDRYSGGRGYLELLSGLGQPASYFCLQNQAWQLLAGDTGLHDRDPKHRRVNVTSMEDGEVAWHLDKLARFGGSRGTILLTHHQLFSAAGIGQDGQGRPLALNPTLHGAFGGVLDQLAWWFWGHEHNLSIHAPYAGLARGRCLGSGAIPIFVAQRPYEPAEGLVVPAGESGPPTTLPGTRLGDNGVVHNHAFAVLRLDGPRATVSYYESDTTGIEPGHVPPAGAPLFAETVTRA
jgi:predicted phosphodiesterase